jgi:hypothetical protein
MIKYIFAKGLAKVINHPKSEWTLKRKYPNVFFIPHMFLKEYLLFKSLCKGKSVFVEYGSGGSTIYLLKEGKQVFSVESNPEFYKYMNTIKPIQEANGKSLHYMFIDVGTSNKWGKPYRLEKKDEWHRYYMEVWDYINPQKIKVDAIFIDGRFRICCILYAILKVVEYSWQNTLFIIHDFWDRKQYHIVLKYLNESKSALRLGSFTVKDHVNVEEIKGLIHQHEFAAD